MSARKTYEMDDKYLGLLDAAEQLAAESDSGEDCLGTLCSLSGEGDWATDESGSRVYLARLGEAERDKVTETGVAHVESYAPGDTTIPTRVARKFGLGEVVVCNNAGYCLQGNELIKRPVFKRTINQQGDEVIVPTTLQEILRQEVKDQEWWHSEVYWMNLEWRHIQMVIDANGGQSETYLLLSKILDRLGYIELESGTKAESWGMMDDVL